MAKNNIFLQLSSIVERKKSREFKRVVPEKWPKVLYKSVKSDLLYLEMRIQYILIFEKTNMKWLEIIYNLFSLLHDIVMF